MSSSTLLRLVYRICFILACYSLSCCSSLKFLRCLLTLGDFDFEPLSLGLSWLSSMLTSDSHSPDSRDSLSDISDSPLSPSEEELWLELLLSRAPSPSPPVSAAFSPSPFFASLENPRSNSSSRTLSSYFRVCFFL